jgi:hypothetical protein
MRGKNNNDPSIPAIPRLHPHHHRSVMGGLYIALGVTPFLLGGDTFTMLGIGYLAIALVRLVSIFVDKSGTQSTWMSLALEAVLGVILVL